jgi:hypothetical protein
VPDSNLLSPAVRLRKGEVSRKGGGDKKRG